MINNANIRGVGGGNSSSNSVGVTELSKLSDVAISNPTISQNLVFDGTKWINQDKTAPQMTRVYLSNTNGTWNDVLSIPCSANNYISINIFSTICYKNATYQSQSNDFTQIVGINQTPIDNQIKISSVGSGRTATQISSLYCTYLQVRLVFDGNTAKLQFQTSYSGSETPTESYVDFSLTSNLTPVNVNANTIWGGITGTLANQTDLQNALNTKQATLVSGTNIKTINGSSILGAGDLVISGMPTANQYQIARKGATDWQAALNVNFKPASFETTYDGMYLGNPAFIDTYGAYLNIQTVHSQRSGIVMDINSLAPNTNEGIYILGAATGGQAASYRSFNTLNYKAVVRGDLVVNSAGGSVGYHSSFNEAKTNAKHFYAEDLTGKFHVGVGGQIYTNGGLQLDIAGKGVGKILKSDANGNALWTSPDAGGSVENITPVTFATAENTTNEITMTEFTIPANSLNVGDYIDIEVLETFKNGTGSTQNHTVKFYWNTVLQSTGIAATSNYNIDAHRIVRYYFIILSTTQGIFYSYNNWGTGKGLFFESLHDNNSNAALSFSSGNNNKLVTIDLTQTNTFKLTHTLQTANANLYSRILNVNARKYKK